MRFSEEGSERDEEVWQKDILDNLYRDPVYSGSAAWQQVRGDTADLSECVNGSDRSDGTLSLSP